MIKIKNKKQIAIIALIAIAILECAFAGDALASRGTAMAKPLKAVNELISGDAAKIVAGISFFFGLVGSIAKFNVAAIATAFGVAITAGAGPAVVQALVTATF